MKEKRRKICKNCKLYNSAEGVCGVTVVHEGEYLELKVRPNDHCWWERMSQELAMIDGEDTEIPLYHIHAKYNLDDNNIKVDSPINPGIDELTR